METFLQIDQYGNKLWRNEAGGLHRADGPAYEGLNGTKEWWFNEKRHRADGPACEYANALKHWFINGKLHRTDGPAIEYANGTKYWFIDGKEYSEAEYNALRCSVCLRTDCPAKEE